jgi:hypothetical protein
MNTPFVLPPSQTSLGWIGRLKSCKEQFGTLGPPPRPSPTPLLGRTSLLRMAQAPHPRPTPRQSSTRTTSRSRFTPPTMRMNRPTMPHLHTQVDPTRTMPFLPTTRTGPPSPPRVTTWSLNSAGTCTCLHSPPPRRHLHCQVTVAPSKRQIHNPW